MSKRAKKIGPGSTLRLELHLKKFASREYMLSAAEVGELFKMLMAEVARQPIPKTKNRFVQEMFDERAEYSRIRGSFARGRLPKGRREAVYERDNGKCRYCGSDVAWQDYHCDHVTPVKRGGGDEISNLATSCRTCNLTKSAKDLNDWVRH